MNCKHPDFSHLTNDNVTPIVVMQRMLSRLPTRIVLRRLHWSWFRFGHTRVWVWARCWRDALV